MGGPTIPLIQSSNQKGKKMNSIPKWNSRGRNPPSPNSILKGVGILGSVLFWPGGARKGAAVIEADAAQGLLARQQLQLHAAQQKLLAV